MLLVECMSGLGVQQIGNQRARSQEGIGVIVKSLELSTFRLVGDGAQKTDLGCRWTESRARGDEIGVIVAEDVGGEKGG